MMTKSYNINTAVDYGDGHFVISYQSMITKGGFKDSVKGLQYFLIRSSLNMFKGNQTKASNFLGLSRSTFRTLAKDFDLI